MKRCSRLCVIVKILNLIINRSFALYLEYEKCCFGASVGLEMASSRLIFSIKIVKS